MSYPTLQEPPKSTSFLSKIFGGPTDSLTDAQIRTLISIPEIEFPKNIEDKFLFFIKRNWKTRQGKKSPLQLARELDHICTREYLQKLMDGDPTTSRGASGLVEDIRQKEEEILDMKPEDKKFIPQLRESIDIKLNEISKIFTDGYSGIFKTNLQFDTSGRPIAVREVSNDRQRMSKCHARLTEDNFARQTVPVAAPDPEATHGLGRRKTKRRRQKRKTRRLRRR